MVSSITFYITQTHAAVRKEGYIAALTEGGGGDNEVSDVVNVGHCR